VVLSVPGIHQYLLLHFPQVSMMGSDPMIDGWD